LIDEFSYSHSFAAFNTRAFPNRVIIQHPPFVHSIASLLSETSDDVLEAYLLTRAALALSPYLGTNTSAWLAQRSLYETLNGIKAGVVGDRAEYCLGQVENTLGFAAGRFFVKETKFGGDSKEKGTKVITGKKFLPRVFCAFRGAHAGRLDRYYCGV